MKYTIILALCLPITVFAQQQITVTESPETFSKGTFNSYKVQIPDAKLKDIDKSWTSYLKKFAKGKVQNINGEYTATGVIYKNISASPVNIYGKLLENIQGVRLTAWLTPNDTIYISETENADQNTAAEKFIRDFAIICYKNVVKDQLDDSKNAQHKLEKKLSGLIKDEEENIKKINENNRSIDRNGDAIRQNEKEQATQTSLLTTQKAIVEKDKDGGDQETLKADEKRLKDYESDMKKLVKDNEKMQADIDNWNRKIRESKRNIDQLKKDKEQLKQDIESQKKVVQTIQDKLGSIK